MSYGFNEDKSKYEIFPLYQLRTHSEPVPGTVATNKAYSGAYVFAAIDGYTPVGIVGFSVADNLQFSVLKLTRVQEANGQTRGQVNYTVYNATGKTSYNPVVGLYVLYIRDANE